MELYEGLTLPIGGVSLGGVKTTPLKESFWGQKNDSFEGVKMTLEFIVCVFLIPKRACNNAVVLLVHILKVKLIRFF